MKAIRQEQVIRQGVAKQFLEIDLRGPAKRGSGDEETCAAVVGDLGFCSPGLAADECMRQIEERGV